MRLHLEAMLLQQIVSFHRAILVGSTDHCQPQLSHSVILLEEVAGSAVSKQDHMKRLLLVSTRALDVQNAMRDEPKHL